MKKYFITVLLFIFYQNSFSQEFQLDKNVFYNDISNIYMSKGQPFTGKIILYREKNESKSENGVSHSFYVQPTSIFYNINKKVIEFKNGKVEGLITTISTKGDTISKFYLRNNKISGNFFYKCDDNGNFKFVKGSSNNDTLFDKIQIYKFSKISNKFQLINEGTFSKVGGKPIGEFKSYNDGNFVFRKVVPFSDNIGMLKIDPNDLKNIIGIDNDILFLSSLKDVINPGGVKLVEERYSSGSRQDLISNNKYVGFSKKVREIRNGKMYELTFSQNFYGDYRDGFNVDNISWDKFKEIETLLEKNHTESVIDLDGEGRLYEKSYENGKLVNDYVDVWDRNYFKRRIHTQFNEGVEFGGRTTWYQNGNYYYEIENIIDNKFNGNFKIYYEKEVSKEIECTFLNGEIKLPITKYYKNGKKNIEILEVNNEIIFSEYFIDGSLKVKNILNVDKLREKIILIFNNHKEDFYNSWKEYFQ